MSGSLKIVCLLGCAMMASTPAFSADSWSGAYIGATAGYGWGKSASNIKAIDDQFTPFFQQQGTMPTTLNPVFNGAMGGGEIGYNWQFGRWVPGIEADLSYARMNDGITVYNPQVGASPEAFTSQSTHLSWFGTARARMGYLATPDTLLFATGGVAYGRVKVSSSYVPEPTLPCASNAICSTGSATENMVGWTLGGGVETKIASKWTAKIEYLHFNLGSAYDVTHSHSTHPLFAGVPVTGVDSEIKGNIVRVGLNYQL